MTPITDPSGRDRWARLRFSIIGHLLAAPPQPGELHRALTDLAAQAWRHPVTGLPVRFGVSTLERWYSAECSFMRSKRVYVAIQLAQTMR